MTPREAKKLRLLIAKHVKAKVELSWSGTIEQEDGRKRAERIATEAWNRLKNYIGDLTCR